MSSSSRQIALDVRLLSRSATSGIPEYTKNLINGILNAGMGNQYILLYTGLRKKTLPKTWTSLPNCSVLDIAVPNKLLDLSARFFSAPKFDKRLDLNLVFSPHFNILPLKKTPHVMTFHDLSFLHHPYFFSYKQRFWHWLQNYKHQARRAKKIIAVSEFTKRDIVSLLEIDPEKIEVIYSGINKAFRPHSKEEIRKFRKKENLKFPFLLYLGTLEPRKNVEAVVRAFTIIKEREIFKDLRLIIAGRPGWLYQNILKEVRRSPCRNHIIFRELSDTDRPLFYSAAEVFVFPSFFEGFGFPPLEAQACGTPAIVSDRTSLPEIMGSTALYINPWRVDELAESIEQILTNTSNRKTLIEEGLRNAKRFDWEKTTEKTLDILNNA